MDDQDDDSLVLVGEKSVGSRKRKISMPKRNAAKIARNSQEIDLQALFPLPCDHKRKKKYVCEKISLNNVNDLRRQIFSSFEKTVQDQRLCLFLGTCKPQRRRPRKNRPTKNHKLTIEYFIPVNNKNERVCQKFFLEAMKISKARIIRISKILLGGGIPKELRGGDQVSKAFEDTKNNIRLFIKKLRGTESHYSRKNTKRIYLSADLSITKLYKIYNSSCRDVRLKTKFNMFYKIFVTEFNIGFRSPSADVCSYCLRLTESIKKEINKEKKSKFMIEKKVHKTRANAFYQLLKKNPNNSISFCFDMQQVQPLPKTPVGESFYLRQISYYTFCCVKTNNSEPVFYTWTEDEAGRGCIEVGSALLDYIRGLEIGPEVHTLRLFCDGCGGQNKNSHIIHTLLFWLQNEANGIKEIQLHFPVRGHSFLPADRIFGVVERKLRKKSVIQIKENYHEIYKEVGIVKVLGKDWKVYDVKELQKFYKKINKISECKRIFFKKTEQNVEIESFPNFITNLGSSKQNLTKRGKSTRHFQLPELPLNKKLNPKKLANVKTLLHTHFGEDWEKDLNLNWYKKILDNTPTGNNGVETQSDNEEGPSEDEECDCLDDEQAIHI